MSRLADNDLTLERALRLIGMGLMMNLDSFDIEACCERHGLDYDTADVGAIWRAVLADYGGFAPGCWPPPGGGSQLR